VTTTTPSSTEKIGAESPWEAAYLRFETPDQEVRKFRRRLSTLGARSWPRNSDVLELFCGRASGLRALAQLGFSRVRGVDLSATLVLHSPHKKRLVVGDCRELPFASRSQDVAIVQGGLHHLLELPHDLEQTVREVRRVLREGGRFVAVEPWTTPFLSFVHQLSASPFVRRLSSRLEALGTMIDLEGETYRKWLADGGPILEVLRSSFAVETCRVQWGKLLFVGRRETAEGTRK
jgi:SAM-dependent methyltransferase